MRRGTPCKTGSLLTCQEGARQSPVRRTNVRAPPAGRPTPKLAGDRPKERRAPTPELVRLPVFFNTLGTHEFIPDFGGFMSEVAAVVRWHSAWYSPYYRSRLHLSFAVVLSPTWPDVCPTEDRSATHAVFLSSCQPLLSHSSTDHCASPLVCCTSRNVLLFSGF